jgi:ADP-ribose pyrophosphatase YjhB (NUDIX family)
MRGSPTNSVDVVLCTPHGRQLAVLLVQNESKRARERWSLPWAPVAEKDALDHTAARVALRAAGARATWLAQAGAFADAERHPGGAGLSVAYLGVTPLRVHAPPDGAQWFPAGKLPPLAPRHRSIVAAARAQLRERLHAQRPAGDLRAPARTAAAQSELSPVAPGRVSRGADG